MPTDLTNVGTFHPKLQSPSGRRRRRLGIRNQKQQAAMKTAAKRR